MTPLDGILWAIAALIFIVAVGARFLVGALIRIVIRNAAKDRADTDGPR
jgi:hypothetical protein